MDNTAVTGNDVNINSGKYLQFAVGNDSYGFNIDCVRELIDYSEITHMTKIPLMNKSILGIMNLRGEIIPLIDLSVRLHDKKTDTDRNAYGIIIQMDDLDNTENKIIIGAIVESFKGITRITENDIISSPGFATSIRSDFINGMVKFKDKLIVLLNVKTLIDTDELSRINLADLKNIMQTGIDEEKSATYGIKKDENELKAEEKYIKYLTISVMDETYGIEISKIREVIEFSEITAIPNTMPFMKGVINLRGEIIPVIDMRERCSLEPKEYNRKTPILIIYYGNFRIGLIADSVNNVIKLGEKNIQQPPHYSSNIDKDFINGMCEISNGLIVLLNIEKILSAEEHDYLKNTDFSGQS